MGRYSFPIPYGWFYIMDAHDLDRGEIRPIRRFGQDLVVWRDEEGALHLQEAYCPHLGAHVGKGGKVIGATIQCPFHKWQFNGDGSVASIPYSEEINKKACLYAFPIKIHYGNLMAWYHPDRVAPLFELPNSPELDSGEFIGPLGRTHTIKTCLQEMAENTVDAAHFVTIHNHPGAATYEGLSFDGPDLVMKSKQVFPSSRGPVDGTLDTYSRGYGFGVVHYRTLVEICMVTVNCPIETELTEQVFQVYYKNPKNDPQVERIAQAFYKEVNRQLTDDIVIWENKIYKERPALCPGDGPIARFRKWASQFYVEAS
ncbi:MAG TPA: Rieske 2Fe-2S domain-containing protein [Alphaproteobacteria bacterium]|nr:Rieske 2Fe-2S domain-containing protein [Alphaproteobacteria bacterium]